MFCTKCGSQLPEGTRFCTKCGNPLDAGQGTYSMPESPTPPPVNYTPQEMSYAPPAMAPKKSKAPLAILLSLLGVVVIALVVVGVVIGVHFIRQANSGDLIPVLTDTIEEDEETSEPEETTESVVTATAVPAQTDAIAEPVEQGDVNLHGVDAATAYEYFIQLTVPDTDSVITRWDTPITVQILGDYTQEDYNRLVTYLDSLNALGTLPAISLVEDGGNFLVYYVPMDTMGNYLDYYEDGYYAYYNWAQSGGYMSSYKVCIASDTNTQTERNYLMLEMVSRGFGVFGNNDWYGDSIFNSGWTDIQQVSDIDLAVLEMLYSDGVTPGMDTYTAQSTLSAYLGLS